MFCFYPLSRSGEALDILKITPQRMGTFSDVVNLILITYFFLRFAESVANMEPYGFISGFLRFSIATSGGRAVWQMGGRADRRIHSGSSIYLFRVR